MKKNKHRIARRMWVSASKPRKGCRQLTDEWKEIRDTKVPLKSGEDYEIGRAKFWERKLRKLSETSPDLLRSLHKMIQGNCDQVANQHVLILKENGLLNDSNLPIHGVRVVMEAAFQETLDGPCIVEPLKIRTLEEVSFVDRFEEERERAKVEGTQRLLGKIEDDRRENEDKGWSH